MATHFQSQPYDWGGGVLFAFRHQGRVRDVYVSPALIQATPLAQMALRDRLAFIQRHERDFIEAARRRAEASPAPAMLTLDEDDL